MNIGIDLTIFRTYQGTEVYTENIIAHLALLASDHKLVIFKGRKQFADLEKLLAQGGIQDRVKFVNFSRCRNAAGVALTQQLLLPLLVVFYRIRVLYSPSPFFSFLAPCKKINTIHDAAYKHYREFRNLFSKLYIQACFKLSFLCRFTLTSSQFSKADLIEQYQFPPSRIVVAGGALPSLPGVDQAQDSGILKKFSLYPKSYLFYIGSLNPRKNIPGMIKAFTDYIERNPKSDLLFVLAGNQNSDFEDLQSVLNNPNSKDKIKFIGQVSNAEKVVLLRNATALFFASHYEGFGLPILEAQSLSVPVITSVTTSMPEVAGEGALLVDPTNIQQLSGAIAAVTDPAVALKLIELGQVNLSKFSWRTCAQVLLRSIEEA